MGRQGRTFQQQMVDLKEKRRYWNLKEEALEHTAWQTHFARGYGHVAKETT